MGIFGPIIGLACAILYSLRSSYVKDIGGKEITKSQVNFYFRLVSLPLIAVFTILMKTNLSGFTLPFYIFFALSLITNILFGVLQIDIYKKHKFSDVEAFFFLIIIFNLISGYFVFGEVITPNKMFGIVIVILAFLSLIAHKKRNGEDIGFLKDIIFYYLLMSGVDLFSKKTINLSTPLAYSLLMSAAQMIVFFFLSLRPKRKNAGLYLLNNFSINKYLLTIGVISSFTAVLVTYGYKLLPLGILATIVSLRVFISLWISHKKYLEDGLKAKLFVTAIAFLGTAIVFIF